MSTVPDAARHSLVDEYFLSACLSVYIHVYLLSRRFQTFSSQTAMDFRWMSAVDEAAKSLPHSLYSLSALSD